MSRGQTRAKMVLQWGFEAPEIRPLPPDPTAPQIAKLEGRYRTVACCNTGTTITS